MKKECHYKYKEFNDYPFKDSAQVCRKQTIQKYWDKKKNNRFFTSISITNAINNRWQHWHDGVKDICLYLIIRHLKNIQSWYTFWIIYHKMKLVNSVVCSSFRSKNSWAYITYMRRINHLLIPLWIIYYIVPNRTSRGINKQHQGFFKDVFCSMSISPLGFTI